MVKYAVKYQYNPSQLTCSNQVNQRIITAKSRINIHVIGCIVFVIRNRFEYRAQINCGNTERFDVIQLLPYAIECAAIKGIIF